MREKREMFIKLVKNFFENSTRLFNVFRKNLRLLCKSAVDLAPQAKEKIFSFVLQWWHLVLAAIFAFIVLYYPAGALLYHRIDLNPRFAAKTQNEQNQMLNTLSELIGREIDTHAFTPNLPFFFPAAILDNMPAFQTGIIQGIQKTIQAFAEVNPQTNLFKQTADLLAYPVSVWHIDQWKPAVSSVKKYRTARHLIAEYETELQEEKQSFNLSPEALKKNADLLAKNLNEAVFVLDRQISDGEKKIFDLQADDVFYEIKGQTYVYFLMVRDMKKVFQDSFSDEIIRQKWEKVLSSLRKAVQLQPLIVMNASPETQFAPNHLIGLGFYLAQAAIDLSDMAESLKPVQHE